MKLFTKTLMMTVFLGTASVSWSAPSGVQLSCKKALNLIRLNKSVLYNSSAKELAEIIAVDKEAQKLISNPQIAQYIYLNYFAKKVGDKELKASLQDIVDSAEVKNTNLYDLVNETLATRLRDPNVQKQVKEAMGGRENSLRPSFLKRKTTEALSQVRQAKGFLSTVSNLKKITEEGFSQTVMDEGLFHFFGATQLGLRDSQLRKWDRIPGGFAAIRPGQIKNMSPEVWSRFAHFTSETEAPIVGYSTNSGEATRGILPSLSLFLGKTAEEFSAREKYEQLAILEGKKKEDLEEFCSSVWCREENRHDLAIKTIGERISGQEHTKAQTYEADKLGDFSNAEEALNHLIGRNASEWNANSVYLFLRAHSTGATNTWVDQIRKDETKHMAIFSTAFKYFYGNQQSVRTKGMLKKISTMKQSASKTNSNSDGLFRQGLSLIEFAIAHLHVEKMVRRFTKTVPLKTMEKFFDSPVKTLKASESDPISPQKKETLDKMIATEKAKRENLERWTPKERALYKALKKVEKEHTELIEGFVLNLFKGFKGAEVFNSKEHKDILKQIKKIRTGLDKKTNSMIQMSLRETLRDYQIMNNSYVRSRDDLIVRFKDAQTGFTVVRKKKNEAEVLLRSPLTESHSFLRVERPKGMELSVGSAMRLTLKTKNGKSSRILSLSSSPKADYLEFAVGNSQSNFKKAFQVLEKGDHIEVEVVSDGLEFDFKKPSVMIAGGIGITPFRSAIQYHAANSLTQPIHLVYGNRNEIPFGQEFHAVENAQRAPFSMTNILSRPNETWVGETGRINQKFLEKEFNSFPENANYYLVGSVDMVKGVQKSLLDLGVDIENINIEVFSSNTPAVSKEKGKEAKEEDVLDENILCKCQGVSVDVISDIIKSGATSLGQIQSETMAGTGCGKCKCSIEKMLSCQKGK